MTGETQSKAALGHAHFDYYARNPEEAAHFIKAMQGSSEIVQGEVVRLLDIHGARTAVDVGGANGALLCALAKAKPDLTGVVYDLPHSRDGGLAYIAQQGPADRIRFESGSFFDHAPVADLYLLKFVLHDWDDESAVRILKSIRHGMNAGGRVALVEMRIGDIGEPGLGPLVDVNMMAVTGGRERTRDEYQRLLTAADLKLDKVTPTQSPFDIFEAVAA
jgi:O-methyltransferase